MKRIMRNMFLEVFIILLLCVCASAESIVPSIPINKNASQEYQLIYLASLCGINVTREGDFFENVNMVRAVTSNINTMISEAFILGFSEEKVHLVANYDFADTASITFASEGIDIEKILPYCSTDAEQSQGADTYDFILNGKRLFLQYSAIKEIYKNSVTTKSFLTIQSPFASDDLNEISISLFDLDNSSR